MTLGDAIALAFILVIFGGSSGLFTFVSVRLMLHRLEERGFYVDFRDGADDDVYH